MATWKYYEKFGQTGGTSSLVYVDSYKGDDANPGTHLLPKQSMQAGFDVISTTGAVMVIAGAFKESNFLSVPSNVQIIAEGHCILDCNGGNFITVEHNINVLGVTAQSTMNVSANALLFGVLELKNVARAVSATTTTKSVWYNCIMDSCFIFGANARFFMFQNCLIKNNFTRAVGSAGITFDVINCSLHSTENPLGGTSIRTFKNNYISPTTKVEFGNISAAAFNYNHFEGTLTDKILINGVHYDNIEAVQAVLTSHAVNDIPSTTDPLFNDMSNEDFTPTENSPLLGAGENGVNIGAFDVSIGQSATSANWTLDNIDNTTNPDAAVLDAGGTGTLTANTGIQLFSDGKRRIISRILLPGSVLDPEFGETINSQLGEDAGIPSKYSVEIQYSTDGGNTYNGTWLKVPYGALPLYDAANNVGNADPAFVSGGRISATHVLPRITLRNND